MSESILEVVNLGKSYPLPLKSKLGSHFWALREVSFQVGPGEVLGIVGANGAGKSTLLKLIARVCQPNEGHFRVKGRLASMLSVGTGFHGDLSGRENIYLSGALLGMTRREIASKFDAIVAFAEIENFIDFPTKHLSSGLAARLAFSVAVHLNSDIVIVDEILSVGDASFQAKCLAQMRSIVDSGKTVMIVSHNFAVLPELCSRALLLVKGKLVEDGPVSSTIGAYLGYGPEDRLETSQDVGHDVGHEASQQSRGFESEHLTILECRCLDEQGTARTRFLECEAVSIEVDYQCAIDHDLFRCGLRLLGPAGVCLFVTPEPGHFESITKGRARSRCTVPGWTFCPGSYSLEVVLEFQGLQRVVLPLAVPLTLDAALPEEEDPARRPCVRCASSWVRECL